MNGVQIFKSLPSLAETPNKPVRQPGAVVYANQNKDLAAWHPGGGWIVAAVEMDRHALTHHLGNSEIGMFNNLWAISVDGKLWVQLTDFASTWSFSDRTAPMPFQCSDTRNCIVGCQYQRPGNLYPYDAYGCSVPGAPPPASGIMRATVGNQLNAANRAPIVWAERVGLNALYLWGGTLQLAIAEIAMVDGLPALVHYARNITPTPAVPSGRGLWPNPGGNTTIGTVYEAWSFSRDDQLIGISSDVFLSTSNSSITQTISPTSVLFIDAITWRWNVAAARLTNVSAYDAWMYPYQNNVAAPPVNAYGHWEEPIVYSLNGRELIAFGSTANLDPPWNPWNPLTFGIETWIVPSDRSQPAARLTRFNGGYDSRKIAYPTAYDPADNSFFLTVVPGGMIGENPPGAIYKIQIDSAPE